MLDTASNHGMFTAGHLIWHRLVSSVANLAVRQPYPEHLEVSEDELATLQAGDYLEEDGSLNCLVRKIKLKVVN